MFGGRLFGESDLLRGDGKRRLTGDRERRLLRGDGLRIFEGRYSGESDLLRGERGGGERRLFRGDGLRLFEWRLSGDLCDWRRGEYFSVEVRLCLYGERERDFREGGVYDRDERRVFRSGDSRDA